MRILITNDDGIASPALPALAAWAKQFGEVTVVAPLVEQSGKSQALEFRSAVEIKRVKLDNADEAWTVDSTPADCVRFGFTGLKREYDLVLSGINRGFNLGDDIAYSGTIGAIFEAARLGAKAIAFSADVDKLNSALAALDDAYAFIEEHKLLETANLLNVNFPSDICKGIRVTKQGGMFYSDDFVCKGPDLYLQVGEPVTCTDNDLSVDITAVRNGYVSITPLTHVKTDLVAYDKIGGLKKDI